MQVFIYIYRLFKENPDLEGDALKVKNDRANLVVDLESLISSVFK
tara:strand:- start:909 stop:1043 length:135 start_codon:yes stop_codon:yes gene_type:complete